MNTVIIKHADEKLTALLKQLADIAGVPLKTKPEKTVLNTPGHEISQAIDDFESGKNAGKSISAEALLLEFEKMINEE